MNRPSETVAQWSERWVASREEKGYTSACDDRGRLSAHILPAIGSVFMREVTRAHLEDLVEKLDARVRRGECSWKTAWNVWGVVTKMFSDACRSKTRALRVRDDNPAKDVAAPDRGVRKIKTFLYPSEFLTLVSCAAVPLAWRRLIAVAVYVYARSGELRALQIEDLDFEHGTIHIHRSESQRRNVVKGTKTGVGRRFSLEPEIVPLLRTLVGDRTKGPVIADMPTERNVSRALRLYLTRAGLKRQELFEGGDTRKNITFHDLRATGITWLAVRGDEPLKIKSRAGHSGFATTEGYIREAEHVAAGFGEVFPRLPEVLVDWSGIGPATVPPADEPTETQAIFAAERAGFEPAEPFRGSPHFQCGAFDHSATSPGAPVVIRRRPTDIFSGEQGIRTLGTVPGTLDFESSAFDHSASSPPRKLQVPLPPCQPRRARSARKNPRRSSAHSAASTPGTTS